MTMRYLVTCNGPTGRLLDEQWVEGKDAANDMVTEMAMNWPARVVGQIVIQCRGEQEIEDGE